MSALVLLGRRRSYTFQRSQLQHYPDSLLTNLALTAEDSNSGHATGDSTLEIRLQDMNNSPLNKHDWAADVADSIYRLHHIAPDVLSMIVKGVEGNSLTHFKQPFSELVDVLSYLGFTRCISKLLPDLAVVPLSQSKVLAFCFAFQDLQHLYQVTKSAEQAVSTMLSYCPFSTPPADPDTGIPQPVQGPSSDADAAAQGHDTASSKTCSKPLINQHGILCRNWHRTTVFAFVSDEQDIHSPLKVYLVKGLGLMAIANEYERYINKLVLGHEARFATEKIVTFVGSLADLKFSEMLGSCRLAREHDGVGMNMKQLVGELTADHIKKAFKSRVESCADHALLSLYMYSHKARYEFRDASGAKKFDNVPLWILCY